MKSSFIIVFAVMALTIMPIALAANAVTLRTPAAAETISGLSAYVLNATLDSNTVGIDHCTFGYIKPGGTETTIIADQVNDSGGDTQWTYSWATANMPTYLARTTNFYVNCSNATALRTSDSSAGVALRQYASTDVPLVVIDFIGAYFVQMVLLAGLIAIVGIWAYTRYLMR